MADERGNGLHARFVRSLDRPCRATADCTPRSSSLPAGPDLSVSSIVGSGARARHDDVEWKR
jgi:hypothetical protein